MTNLKYEYLIKRDLNGLSNDRERVVLDKYFFSRINCYHMRHDEKIKNKIRNKSIVVCVDMPSVNVYESMDNLKKAFKPFNGVFFCDTFPDGGDFVIEAVDYAKKMFYHPETKDFKFDYKEHIRYVKKSDVTKTKRLYQECSDIYNFIMKEDIENGKTNIIMVTL